MRVLIKKVQDAGVDCSFVPWTVNQISKNMDSVALITLFMDAGEEPDEEIIHYLIDMLEEKDLQMIIVGEQQDIRAVVDRIPPQIIFRTFSRPVDNNEFSKTVTDYLTKAAEGEFRKSILIVDDDPQYLTMVREWLKGTYKVAMANSGLQAIKWLGKNKVDLILLDHEMPVTSGPRVLEMLLIPAISP